MKFRHGFKSQCERRSVEFRRQLGLKQADPLSADQLATHFGVTVWSIRDIAKLDRQDVSVLTDKTDDSWAALTMRIGTENLVVYKPVGSTGRQNNVIMHELAHIILGHDLADACIMEDGSLAPGNFDQAQENEADWLAGTLLLPRPALMLIRGSGISDKSACQRYKVSREMLVWRVRMTGVNYQLANSRRDRGGT